MFLRPYGHSEKAERTVLFKIHFGNAGTHYSSTSSYELCRSAIFDSNLEYIYIVRVKILTQIFASGGGPWDIVKCGSLA